MQIADNLEPKIGISLPPSTIVGYRENGKPIYNIAGGSVEVSSDSDDNDTVETDSTESDEEDDAWTPPTREEYERLVSDKRKADSEAAARKRWLRENGIDPKTGSKVQKPSLLNDSEDDVDTTVTEKDDSPAQQQQNNVQRPTDDQVKNMQRELQRQLEREVAKAEQRFATRAETLLAAVPEALNEEGWNGKNLKRMIKLLDLDNVHVDSDGDVDGLKEQVQELKQDFPEFFKRARMKEAAKEAANAGAVGAGKKEAPASEEDQDWKERLKRQLYGN